MPSLQLESICVALILLLAANGAPVVAARVLGRRWACRIDSGRLWRDGRPILGPSKTWRGLLSSAGGTALVAALFGKPLALGAIFGALSMAGDLASSFVKRRLGVKSSDSVLVLDQVPEALLPTACLAAWAGLGIWDVVAVTVGFTVLGIGLATIRDRLRTRTQSI